MGPFISSYPLKINITSFNTRKEFPKDPGFSQMKKNLFLYFVMWKHLLPSLPLITVHITLAAITRSSSKTWTYATENFATGLLIERKFLQDQKCETRPKQAKGKHLLIS